MKLVRVGRGADKGDSRRRTNRDNKSAMPSTGPERRCAHKHTPNPHNHGINTLTKHGMRGKQASRAAAGVQGRGRKSWQRGDGARPSSSAGYLLQCVNNSNTVHHVAQEEAVEGGEGEGSHGKQVLASSAPVWAKRTV